MFYKVKKYNYSWRDPMGKLRTCVRFKKVKKVKVCRDYSPKTGRCTTRGTIKEAKRCAKFKSKYGV